MVDGWPIAHHVFKGNWRDAKTVPEVLSDLEQRFGLKRVVFVGDAVAILSPAFRTRSLSPLPGTAVAATSEDSVGGAEGSKPGAAEAASGITAQTASQTPSNRWGANYFPNVPVID
jgi:hypothetical protein